MFGRLGEVRYRVDYLVEAVGSLATVVVLYSGATVACWAWVGGLEVGFRW